ncbi:hypothetical protein HUE56_29690 (plasmid) [Azospirillum oryzae]|uniref:Uncharacterized protein n=1 Tax=Azospirillum oryzae TaxID=286727 RepID=A0A6N1ASU1_9PROT|nr:MULTISPECIES: hypothetical protein [Azospirillum]KAA0584750.1 hypothetical protein FZ938_28570 [Azospirillum oryzae]QCG99220.1 hypothetical protein E6C67_36140 [Azospirillum sp. TSA2s]QKS54676.1 hypothetical protein HUE56_29690 [Azospirillum oryzae]GLR77566.1 hypothetical protein GCM10007856_02340 [Azospirillum oryzae]
MENQNTLFPIPGTPEYFAARKVAFALIREVETAKVSAERAPTYVAGCWDDDNEDYEPVENTKPWDHLGEVQKMAKANRLVIETLKAQRRLDLLGISRWEAEAIIHGEPADILYDETVLVYWQGLTYDQPCAYAQQFDIELARPPGSICYLLTKTTHFSGVRPGQPGRWKEITSSVFTDRDEAETRYCRILSSVQNWAQQVRDRYKRAA